MNQQAGAKQTGFTLVEVLVVVVIIGILAGLAVPAIFVAMQKVEDGTAIVEVKLVAQALDAYKVEYGEYPPDFTNHQHVIDHLNRIFPRRREWRQVDEVFPLDPHVALLFWLRGFFANPEYPITGGDINGDGIPDSERKPFVEFNVAMIVAADTNDDQIPDGDLDLDTPGDEFLAPSKMPQSPIVYFDSRSNQGAVSSYQLLGNNPPENIPKSFVLAGNGGTAMPYMWSETYSKSRQKYVNPDAFQLISAGRDGHFGDPNDNRKWYPEGLNYDEYDADNITSFSTNTLGNSIP